jgi:hypothetical protein
MKAIRNICKGFSANTLLLCLIAIQFCLLTFLYLRNPIKTPITDDWLYLGIGTHQSPLLRVESFELINGHQQFLVKFLVWLVGFLPGMYISYIWYLNAILAFSGIYLMISSQIVQDQKKNLTMQIVLLVVILCNFKPLYLYMSVTGTGLCLTMLIFGTYYFASNKLHGARSNTLKTICAFLAPFATGFGISLTVAHVIELFFSGQLRISFKSCMRSIKRAVTPLFGFALAYLLPTVFGVLNPRSPENGSTKLSNILDLIQNPLKALLFFLGLLGSTLMPSSRFDPTLAVLVGSLLITLIILNFLLLYSLKGLVHAIISNKTPFLAAMVFVLMLIVFRGLGELGSVSESVAPRYVMGTSLLVFGAVVLILERQNSRLKEKVSFYSLGIVLLCSITGIKTGSEWLSVRSPQTTALYSCLQIEKIQPVNCLVYYAPIEEGESDYQSSKDDLTIFSQYLF